MWLFGGYILQQQKRDNKVWLFRDYILHFYIQQRSMHFVWFFCQRLKENKVAIC